MFDQKPEFFTKSIQNVDKNFQIVDQKLEFLAKSLTFWSGEGWGGEGSRQEF